MKTWLREQQNKFFAAFYPRTITRYERAITPTKKELFESVAGNVLEIGPGPGSNLVYCGAATEWTGVEPNRFMHRWIDQKSAKLSVEAEILNEPAELLDLPPASFDVVIGTLVLCSVTSPSQVLETVLRLLKPGGRYLFIEHVAESESDGALRFQKLIRPLWQCCADGCRADLDALTEIEAAGFSSVDAERFRVSNRDLPWFLTPHIAGCAIR